MRTWHRRIGIASAIVVVWLALTGLLLGHTEDLGLDERHLDSGWLLDWYGVRAPEIGAGYRVGEAWIIQAGERIYFNHRPLGGRYAELLGAVAIADQIAVAADDRLLVLSRSGALIEALGAPRGTKRIGVLGGQLVAGTDKGAFAAGEPFLEWQRFSRPQDALWSATSAPPQALSERIADDYRGRVLTFERVVLDLHSGRLFGWPGAMLMDLAAFAFLGLAATGLWLWLRRGNGLTSTHSDR